MNTRTFLILLFAVVMVCLPILLAIPDSALVPPNRTEVVFWHFWGGQTKTSSMTVVVPFQPSQDQYFVRAVAMPGNNLQAKLFLSSPVEILPTSSIRMTRSFPIGRGGA